MTVLSNALLEAIESSGLTIYRIAKDAGLDFMAVSRFVKGERGLNLESADKLAEFFELEVVHKKPKKRGKK